MNQFTMDLERYIREEKGEKAQLLSAYTAVCEAAMKVVEPTWRATHPEKKVCYFSAEFLIGRMIYSNLFNLGLWEEFRECFAESELDPNMFEQVEDAALGNGGLGRLAACLLDSAATQGYHLDGYGIRYRYGLFKQYFQKGFQREMADDWLYFGDPWSLRREPEKVLIHFQGQSVWAVPYDMPMIGYGGKRVNTLRLWQAEAVDAFDFDAFDQERFGDAFGAQNAAATISSVLYPNDNSDEGRRLRLKQQYFFCSASLQSMVSDYKKRYGNNFSRFADSYAIQLNDTHPTVAIPELIRLFMTGENMGFEAAFAIAQRTFAYTNHTILAEALEKWPVALFCSVIPEVYPYIIMLQNHLKQDLHNRGVNGGDQIPYYLVDNGVIHMARMAIFATHSINGVAELHTDILKKDALPEWYAVYPERFSNKTNGITQRRWLGLCNREYARFITERIGDGWLTHLEELEKLVPYANDGASLRQFEEIKREKKRQLAYHVKYFEFGEELNIDSIFDIQIKRLHEYKRQLLNAFSLLDIYFSLKEGTLTDFYPMTALFGAKAAPAYSRAKGIIKFINEIARLLNRDPDTRHLLKVLFVQNYNVSYAEKLIPAADISEQISTAGKEASGTGNMKFMLNGAVTLGTYDGANIEIVQRAGVENNYIFGARVEELRELAATYCPREIYYSNARIQRVVNTLVDGTLYDDNSGMFRDLYQSLLEGDDGQRADQYFVLKDFESYAEARLRANRDYRDREAFIRKCLLNSARSGYFSSDRTIRQYNEEIWYS